MAVNLDKIFFWIGQRKNDGVFQNIPFYLKPSAKSNGRARFVIRNGGSSSCDGHDKSFCYVQKARLSIHDARQPSNRPLLSPSCNQL